MPFEFGDVVLVPFPFTSQRASKKRPAVVVRNSAYSTAWPDLVVIAVTSQLRPNPGLGDAWISHWQAGGLLKPSVVKTGVRDPRTEACATPARHARRRRPAALRKAISE